MIFISHSGSQDAVARVVERLGAEGYEPFADFDPEHGLEGDMPWPKRLYLELERADAVVFVGTKLAYASPWCHTELALTRWRGRQIFLLHEPGADATDDPNTARTVRAITGLLTMEGSQQLPLDDLDPLVRDLKRQRVRRGGLAAGVVPFPGLDSYDESQEAAFFGRAQEIGRITDMLQGVFKTEPPARLAVSGPSGCGKSSLVAAGVVPALKALGWHCVGPARVGGNPFASVLTALAAPTPAGGNLPAAATAALRGVIGDGPALLVLDQGEELAKSAHRDEFLAWLREVTQDGCRVLGTFREDVFYAESGAPLRELFVNHIDIERLDRDALRGVVEEAIRAARIGVDEGLIDQIFIDVPNGDALPLLAFVLRALYEESPSEWTREAYEGLGGIKGAIEGAAEAASSQAADAGHGEVVLPAMQRFVAINTSTGHPTRQPVLRGDLSEPEQVVAGKFESARLLTARGLADAAGNEVPAVEVAHEALFDCWPPLREWIKENRASIEELTRVRQEAAHWERTKSWRDLLDGKALRSARPFRREIAKEPSLRAFVRRSRIQSSSLRIAAAALVFVLAGLTLNERASTGRARQATRETRSEQLAAQALGLINRDPGSSVTLALRALGRTSEGRSARAEPALRRAVSKSHLRRVLARKHGHDDHVRAVAVTPDGALALTGSADKTVEAWNPLTGEPVGEPFDLGQPVNAVALSANGEWAAAGGDSGRVAVWNIRRPVERFSFDRPRGVHAVAMHPTAERIVVGAKDQRAYLSNFDGSDTITLRGHTAAVRAAAFDSAGGRIATGGDDERIMQWNLDGTRAANAILTRSRVTSVAFDPGGTRIAAGSEDQMARIWPTAGGSPVTFAGHSDYVMGVGFTRDGSRLVTAGRDRAAFVWDSAAGTQLLGLHGHSGALLGLAVDDGGRVVTGSEDTTARVWDTTTDRTVIELRGHRGSVRSVRLDLAGDRAVTASEDGTARIWNARTGVLLRTLVPPPEPTPTGGDEIPNLEPAPMRVALFTRDGASVVTVDEDGYLRVWNADSGAQVGKVLVCKAANRTVSTCITYGLDLSPDGTTVVVTTATGSVRLVRLTDLSVQDLGERTGRVYWAAFSPDGRYVASTGGDSMVTVWNVDERKQEAVLRGDDIKESLRSVAFSPAPGSRIIAAGTDHKAFIWEWRANQDKPDVLKGSTRTIRSAYFTSNGDVITAGEDNVVRRWSRPPWRAADLVEHDSVVYEAHLATDGRLLTASGDGTARVYPQLLIAPLSEVVDYANAQRRGQSDDT